jgi:DNA-binding transcriptional LysR family regulator
LAYEREPAAMLIAQLEAFLAVAERRSVSRAAKSLYLTQPALSARLRNLERDVGTALFVRTSKGVRLTPSGHAFRPFAQRVLQTIAEGRRVVAELETDVGERLVLGAAPAASAYLLPALVKRFQDAHPNARVIVLTGHSEEVLEMVLRERVQLGLVRELGHPDIVTVPISVDDVVLVVRPNHPFARREAIRVDELDAARLIMFDRTSSYFELTSPFFREAGVVPTALMEVDNVEAAKKMVEQGLGAALLPRSAVADELASRDLIEVRIDGAPVVQRTIAAIRRREPVAPSALADVFLRTAQGLQAAERGAA